MPGINALVQAIAADVNAQLVTNGYPALTKASNGQSIGIGMQYVDENADAPYIVLVPKISKFSARSTPNARALNPRNPLAPGAGVRAYVMTGYGQNYQPTDTVTIGAPDLPGGVQATASLVVNNGGVARLLPTTTGSGYVNRPSVTIVTSTGSGAAATSVLGLSAESLTQIQQRALFTETVVFECHVWGVTPAGQNPDTDFDAAQVLYQQLIESAYLLAPGIVRPTILSWAEARNTATQIDLRGRYAVLGLEIDTPLMTLPLAFANAQVRSNITAQMNYAPTGTIETGWSGLG